MRRSGGGRAPPDGSRDSAANTRQLAGHFGGMATLEYVDL
jgi:hypothetical protein